MKKAVLIVAIVGLFNNSIKAVDYCKTVNLSLLELSQDSTVKKYNCSSKW
jgi:hypothetical protein